MPGYVYRVKVLINLYLWYILNEGLEFRVQCMICFILMQNAILLCKTCILSLLRTDRTLEYWPCRWYSATHFTAFTKLLNTMYKHVPSDTRLDGLPQKRLNKYMQLPALLRST